MVNKCKTLLKKEKGFTLVELLAVLVILGIILAIAIPAVGNVIATSKIKAEIASADLILDAARLADANDDFVKADGTDTTIGDLIPTYLVELDADDYPTGLTAASVIKKDSSTGVFNIDGYTYPTLP